MALNFNQVTKVEIPKYPYQQVEYLNFNGTDNYMYPKLLFGDIAIITEFEFSLSNINSGCIVGFEALLGYIHIYASNGKLYVKSYYYGAESVYYETMCNLTKDAKYKLRIKDYNPTVELTLTQNETTLFSDSFSYYYRGEQQYGQDKAYLMARNLGGESLGTADQFATGKIYSFKQWGSSSGYPDNTQFVPILNTSTGDVGLVCNYSSYIETPYLMNGTITSSSIGNAVVPTIQFPTVEVTQIQRGSTILWRNKRLVSIALTNPTTSFIVGDQFSFGGTVTATYSDGTTANVTSLTSFSGYDMSTAGTQTVTASYGEFGVTASATYQITITSSKVLESITLSGQTTSLNRGTSFSFGGTVTANYNDGTTADVTSSTTFSGYNMSLGGTYTVTATYTEDEVTKTATYTLTVNKIWSQIWSGSKEIGVSLGTASGDTNNWQRTQSSTGYNPTIRITFTMTTSGTASYVVNGATTSTKPSSPNTMTLSVGTSSLTVLRARGGTTTVYGYGQIQASRDTSNNRVNLSLVSYKAGNFTGTGKIKITKIEQYY